MHGVGTFCHFAFQLHERLSCASCCHEPARNRLTRELPAIYSPTNNNATNCYHIRLGPLSPFKTPAERTATVSRIDQWAEK